MHMAFRHYRRYEIYPTQRLPCHYVSLHRKFQHKGLPAHRLDTLFPTFLAAVESSEELFVIFQDKNGI